MMAGGVSLIAHNGPAYPIVPNRIAGNYQISLWADPDASDDGSADGRFWATVTAAQAGAAVPPDTEVKISIWPIDRPTSIRTARTAPVEHEPSRWFVAFVIDQEGRYGVRAAIAGPLGPAEVEAIVDSAYDQRPRPLTVVLFILPFLLIGFVWVKLIFMRRRAQA
jgi:hypothetical protein